MQQAFRSISGFAQDAFAEAREAAKIGRLTDAVIKSTGKAAKVSSAQVGALADKLGELSGVDDDAVQAGTNLLLTFTKVRNETGKGNDIFNQAAAAALDMSAAMNNGTVTAESYRGTILQIGKALNDPVRGMNALRRAGVTFDEQQKKQIKTLVEQGKTAEAQKIILKELAKEFGGAAAAATDDAQKASVAWANFKERIGTLVLPIIGKLAKSFTEKVLPVIEQRVIPALVSFGRWIRDTLVPAVREFGGIVREKLGVVMGFVADVWQRFKPVAETIAKVIGPAFQSIVENLRKAWESLQPSLSKLVPILKAVGIIVGVFIVANVLALIGILTGLAAVIRYVIVPIIQFLLTVGEFVAKKFLRAFELTVSWFKNTFWPGLIGVFRAVGDFIRRKIDDIVGFGRRVIEIYKSFRDGFQRARDAVIEKIGEIIIWVRSIPGKISNALSELPGKLFNAGVGIIAALINGIKSKIGDVRDVISGVARTIRDHLPFSPAKTGPLSGKGNPMYSGRAIGRLLAKGLDAEQSRVANAMAGLLARPDINAAFPTLAGAAFAGGVAPVANYFENRGVIGSQRELDNWLIKALDRLKRERRL